MQQPRLAISWFRCNGVDCALNVIVNGLVNAQCRPITCLK